MNCSCIHFHTAGLFRREERVCAASTNMAASQPDSAPPPLAQPIVTPPPSLNSQDAPSSQPAIVNADVQTMQEQHPEPSTMPWPSTPAKIPPHPIDTTESPEPPTKRAKKASEQPASPKPIQLQNTQSDEESEAIASKLDSVSIVMQGLGRPGTVRRTRRKPSTSLGTSDIAIQDFVDEGILKPGDELKCTEQIALSHLTLPDENIGGPLTAFLTKDGWLTGDVRISLLNFLYV